MSCGHGRVLHGGAPPLIGSSEEPDADMHLCRCVVEGITYTRGVQQLPSPSQSCRARTVSLEYWIADGAKVWVNVY